jgi:hypothetical protein
MTFGERSPVGRADERQRQRPGENMRNAHVSQPDPKTTMVSKPEWDRTIVVRELATGPKAFELHKSPEPSRNPSALARLLDRRGKR